jgi:HD superfamily phosphodiesterase
VLSIENRQLEEIAERYRLPPWLRQHSALALEVADAVGRALVAMGERVNLEDTRAAAYLHDIGKSPLISADGRDHNELSAEILVAEGLSRLAEPARRHIVYAIRDPRLAPRTLEEKIVYYADRRAALRIVTIEERLREQARRFPDTADQIMACLEPAKALERELFARLPLTPEQICATP